MANMIVGIAAICYMLHATEQIDYRILLLRL